MARVASILVRSMGLAAGVGLLASCGGGGAGGIADGGIRGTGSSVGPVSGFASVFVNGIRFSTDGEVTSDDGITRESQLEKGMILRVDGQWRDDGQGEADRLSYDDTFRGPVADVALDATTGTGQFTILGQTILIDRQTVLRLGPATALANGQYVRVSAWPRGDGRYRASFVGVIPDDGSVELEGAIKQGSVVNTDSEKTFMINDRVIDFRDPVSFDGITADQLEELALAGTAVEVEGSVSVSDSNVIEATDIGLGESRRYRRGSLDDIEFAGPVGGAVSNRRFFVNGLEVVIDDDTDFDDGFRETDLAPGVLIQVEGDFQSDGTVLAEEIELREANTQLEGAITIGSINPAEQTFEVDGVLIQVTASTIITADDEDIQNRLDFEDLVAGQSVEVAGIQRDDANGQRVLEAVKIELEDDDDQVEDEED